MDEDRHSLNKAKAQLEQHTGKHSSRETLKSVLKKHNYNWHRSRRSLKRKQNSELFEKARITQHGLETLTTLEKINLYYFDESGFTTQPSVPYAWQPKGETKELPSFHRRRFNILGFLSKQQPTYFHSTEQRVNTQTDIDAFESFVTHYANNTKHLAS